MDDRLVVALYKFVALPDYQELRQPLLELCRAHQVFGTFLFSKFWIPGHLIFLLGNIGTFV